MIRLHNPEIPSLEHLHPAGARNLRFIAGNRYTRYATASRRIPYCPSAKRRKTHHSLECSTP